MKSLRILLRAWPQCRLPLAYGGPSWSTKRSPVADSDSLPYSPYSLQNRWISGSRSTALARCEKPVWGKRMVAAKGFGVLPSFSAPSPAPRPLAADAAVDDAVGAVVVAVLPPPFMADRNAKDCTPRRFLPPSAMSAERKTAMVVSDDRGILMTPVSSICHKPDRRYCDVVLT
jgi:hypothetical protein